jgi:23S rRNA (adenine2503-C2)-methyltransferase
MSATPRLSSVPSLVSSDGQNPPTVRFWVQLLTELTEWVQQQGQPAYRGRQLHGWIYQKGARSLSEISVFPKQWREALS